jgi:hypothetical protein
LISQQPQVKLASEQGAPNICYGGMMQQYIIPAPRWAGSEASLSGLASVFVAEDSSCSGGRAGEPLSAHSLNPTSSRKMETKWKQLGNMDTRKEIIW